MVILDVETSREVARATTEEMASNICELLNHQSKVNNGVLDDVIVSGKGCPICHKKTTEEIDNCGICRDEY